MEKNNQVVDIGEVVCGFGVRKTYEGQKDFDECYKEVTIKQRVKKVGDGESDFIIEEYEDVKEIPIREVIDAQVDQVGIEAYMRPYTAAGMDLPGVELSEDITDFSGFPEDPAEAMKVGDHMIELFNNLDPNLRGDAKSVEEFLSGLTDEKLRLYLLSKLNVEKVEENKNEK